MCKSVIILLSIGLFCSCSRKAASQSEEKPVAKGASLAKEAKPPVVHNDIHLYPVRIKDRYGYIDNTGKLVLKAEYAGASRFSEGMAAVQMKPAGKVGFIDEKGKLVIEPQFELADPFSEGMAAVLKAPVWGYIDKSGKMVITPAYASGGRFSDGLAPVASVTGTTASFGYINPKGDFVIAHQYESASPFGDGLAAVRSLGEKVKYIDKTGKTVIQPQYLTGGDFPRDWLRWRLNAPEGVRWGFINTDGKMVVSAQSS